MQIYSILFENPNKNEIQTLLSIMTFILRNVQREPHP